MPFVLLLLSVLAAQPPLDRAEIEVRLTRVDDLLQRRAAREALPLVEPLLDAPELQDPALAGRVHYSAAQAYYLLDRYTEALEHYRRAADAERAIGDRSSEARTLRSIAQLHKNRGDYAEGISRAEQALAIYDSLQDARNAALTYIVLGAIHDLMGDHRGALDQFQRAVPVIGSENSANAANLANEMAISYKNLGDYTGALSAYSRGLEIYTALKDVRNQAVVLGNLGVLYATIGDDERALGYNLEAVRLSRQINDRRFITIGSLNLADSYWRLGNSSKAIETLQGVLLLSRDIGARDEEALALKNLADLHFEAGDTDASRKEYRDALSLVRSLGDRRSEGSIMIALADLHLKVGENREALDVSQRALVLAREMGRRELEWSARKSIASAAAATGDLATAIEELRASAQTINDLRANVSSDADKVAFVDRRQAVFDELAHLLVRTGRPGEALEAAEAGRARAFADLMKQRTVMGKPAERDALVAVRGAERDLRRALDENATESAAPAEIRASAVTRGADSLRARLATLDAEHHELASLLSAQAPSVAEIQQTTQRLGATLVEYLVTEGQLLAWAVGRDGIAHAAMVPVTRAHLDALTRTVRDGIDVATDMSRAPTEALHTALRELDTLLIAPLAEWMPPDPDAPVVIVPHGPLALVPFAALEDNRGRPLIERHVLAFAPAASVYLYTRAKLPDAAARSDHRALVIADPLPPRDSTLARLPWARVEGRNVAARTGRTGTKLLTGEEASEAAVKRDAGGFPILHFATHGIIVPERPLASSLMLTAGQGEDGYLRVDEIFSLDLRARLVVLSGCSTGLGKLTGDGIVGLTRAFLYAGSPTVVVSQWNVSDKTTSLLMDGFYAALSRGATTARALRTAALSVRKQFPHPSSWAAFEVVGEP